MSKMGDMYIEIYEMIQSGWEDQDIRDALKIPQSWIETVRQDFEEDKGEEDYDDSMDGDHASALASAGWGTDEDYGYYGEQDDF